MFRWTVAGGPVGRVSSEKSMEPQRPIRRWNLLSNSLFVCYVNLRSLILGLRLQKLCRLRSERAHVVLACFALCLHRWAHCFKRSSPTGVGADPGRCFRGHFSISKAHETLIAVVHLVSGLLSKDEVISAGRNGQVTRLHLVNAD